MTAHASEEENGNGATLVASPENGKVEGEDLKEGELNNLPTGWYTGDPRPTPAEPLPAEQAVRDRLEERLKAGEELGDPWESYRNSVETEPNEAEEDAVTT